MHKIILDDNPRWLWMQLIEESQQVLSITLPDEVVVYVLHMLNDHACSDSFAGEVLSIQYATLRQQDAQNQLIYLPRLADEALLLAGLYPEQSFRRSVDPTYFQHIGMRIYADASTMNLWRDRHKCQLYNDMAVHFSQLIQLLFYVRCLQQGALVKPAKGLSGHCYCAYDKVYASL